MVDYSGDLHECAGTRSYQKQMVEDPIAKVITTDIYNLMDKITAALLSTYNMHNIIVHDHRSS